MSAPVAGATSAVFTTPVLNASTVYWVKVSNGLGSVNSTAVQVVVAGTPSLTYTVTYNGNGSTGGAAPTDGNSYLSGATVTVLGNTGGLVKTSSTFAGWNSAANGSGASYTAGSTFAMASLPVVLYAQWTPDSVPPPVGALAMHLHYPFDAGTGTLVEDRGTAGFNHSVTVAAPQWTAQGKYGAGWGPADMVSSTPRVQPSNAGDLNFNPRANAFTIATWVRVGTTAVAGYRTIFDKTEGSNRQMRMWAPGSWSRMTAYVGNALVTLTLPNGAVLNDGQWHLFSLVNYNDNGTWRFRLYYDGGVAFAQGVSGTGGVTNGMLSLGDTAVGGNPWRGNLDDVRIYGRALSQAEIGQLYAGTIDQPATATYAVTYNGNGATSGTVPPSQTKTQDMALTLATNSGNLVRTGYTFAGWNTAADGSGTSYQEKSAYTANAAAQLYASWTAVAVVSDLLLYFPLDAGAGTLVEDHAVAGADHSATVAAPQWTAQGKYGAGWGPADTVSSTPRVQPSNAGDLNFNPRANAFTIATWVRVGTTAMAGYRTIFDKTEGSNRQLRLWAPGSWSRMTAYVGNALVTLTLPNGAVLNDGQWHLFSLVNYNDNGTWRFRLYYDGGVAFAQGVSGTGGVTNGILSLGDTAVGGNSWRGNLDDVRIYNRALSQAEIGQLHAGTLDGLVVQGVAQ